MPRKKFQPKPLASCRNTDARTWTNSEGYTLEYCPDHPLATTKNQGIFYQHRLSMEQFLDRILEKDEHVHHIDGNRKNNAVENLELVPQWLHLKAHAIERGRNSATKNPEIVKKVCDAANSGLQQKKTFCKESGLTNSTVSRILAKHGIRWISPLEKRLDPQFVEQTLRQHTRTEALRILDCSVQHLWNHFPELMSMTANRKLKKWGGQWDAPAHQTESPHERTD